MANLTGWHLLIILAIVLLLFGAPRLPALARSLGQSMKIFKSEIKDPEAEKAKADAAAAAASHSATGSTAYPTVPSDSGHTSSTVNPADTNPKP